jgi:hypothetical protein
MFACFDGDERLPVVKMLLDDSKVAVNQQDKVIMIVIVVIIYMFPFAFFIIFLLFYLVWSNSIAFCL